MKDEKLDCRLADLQVRAMREPGNAAAWRELAQLAMVRHDEMAAAARRAVEAELDGVALEKVVVMMKSAGMSSVSPDQYLSVIRERLDADYCCLVQNGGSEAGSTIAPGSIVGRDGRSNRSEWKVDPKQAQKLDDLYVPGEAIAVPEERSADVRAIFSLGEASEAVQGLTSFFLVYLSLFGERHGVIGIGFRDRLSLSETQKVFVRRSALIVQMSIERAEAYQRMDFARLTALFRSDIAEYMMLRTDSAEIENYIGERIVGLTGAQHVVLYQSDGARRDWFSVESPERTPACSSVEREFKRPNGKWWRVIADFTTPSAYDFADVSLALQASLDLVAAAREREQTLAAISRQMHNAVEMNERLIAERDRAEEAEKSKAAFFSSVSHDIRTPLNAIIGFSELLQDENLPRAEQKADLGLIESSGKALLHLIDDLLDLSKLEAGKMAILLEPTDFRRLVGELLPVFRPMADKKNQTLVADVPEIPSLLLDPYRLRQILFNLVGNAVKYAGPCTVRVSAGWAYGKFSLVVEDNGKGISTEDAARLLQPYAQARAVDRMSGTGLGLSICKQLAERMGGTFTLDSELGAGCRFTVTLPTRVATDAERRAADPGLRTSDSGPGARLPLTRVLVVDDSTINRLVLEAMLKKLGVGEVVTAEDGKAALAILEKSPDFDLVMTDMRMPEMSGGELVARIRATPALSGLKVCLNTADVDAQKSCSEQGFDAILLKPVTLDTLSQLLNCVPRA